MGYFPSEEKAVHHNSGRLSGLYLFGAALTCLISSAQAEDSPAKPPDQPVPSPAGQPLSPNMIHLEPAWPMSPPVTGFDPPKGVRTIRVIPEAASGDYFVQVTVQPTEAEARAAFETLKAKFYALFEDRQMSIRQTILGGKTAHRVLVGPFAAVEEAGELCTTLKSVGGTCAVRRD
jgi:cell division septation protein DedD